MGIDYQGHLRGAGSREYEEAVGKANVILSLLMEDWMKEGYQIVITADHGMNTLGIHGGTDAEQRDTPLYIFSSQVKAGRFEENSISQLNVAPLLCRLMDMPASREMMGLEEIALA